MENIDKVVINPRYDSYEEAKKHMLDQGVRHLGWINDSTVTLPESGKFEKVYSNYSGSSCLYVDVTLRQSYSVDMGD